MRYFIVSCCCEIFFEGNSNLKFINISLEQKKYPSKHEIICEVITVFEYTNSVAILNIQELNCEDYIDFVGRSTEF